LKENKNKENENNNKKKNERKHQREQSNLEANGDSSIRTVVEMESQQERVKLDVS